MVQSIFLFFVLSLVQAFACSMCSLNVPFVKVDVNVTSMQNSTNFNVRWFFDKEFVSTLKQYDNNRNGKLDEDEKSEIEDALFVYVKKTNYLTAIKYGSLDTFRTQSLQDINPYKSSMTFQNGAMFYDYSFKLDIKLKKYHRLDIGFFDLNRNFMFSLENIIINKYNGKEKIKVYAAESRVFFDVDDLQIYQSEYNKIEQKTIKEDDINITEQTQEIQENSNNIVLEKLSSFLNSIKSNIKELLNDIKENNAFISYFWLLLFSFLYGVIHAIGPGHGKSLVSTYFLNENRSISKAAAISLLIGVVHTFSAFVITVVIFFIIKTIFISFVNDIEYIATKISAIMIIAIAIYLLYKKYKVSTKKLKFTTHDPNASSCGCSSCNTKSEDIMIILAAGIVPCPGTITVFIFTMGMGIYFVGFLSAIFMSFGMSLIIFIMAYLSIGIRKKSQSNIKLIKYIEYGSLFFILSLGILLLLG
jgi:ABC-type nickel/cobalt efflux system permease component RcnA